MQCLEPLVMDGVMGLNELQGSFVLSISGIGGLVFAVLVGFAMDLQFIRRYRIDVVNLNVFIGLYTFLILLPFIVIFKPKTYNV